MYFPLILITILCYFSTGNGELVNAKLERNIDITSQLVKFTIKLTIENTGKSPVSTFLYALEPDTKTHLSAFTASQIHDDGKIILKTEDVSLKQSPYTDKDLIKVHFKNPLQSGKSTVVRLEKVLTHALSPFPSSVTQSEKQLVLYHGSHYYYSPYLTKSQTTVFTLPSNSVESFTKLKPFSQQENLYTFGTYENILPFTFSKLSIHFENNSPFLSVTNLNRAIEVSHWGMISVEEDIDIAHTGALLKGSFSRYEFQRDQSGISAVKSIKTVLPASANDVYYRDEIGNISTSHLRVLDDSAEVELRPRFPLFGGWKTHYVLGYNVPTYEYLYNKDEQYVLKMRFVDHVFDDSVIDKCTVRVILPELSRNIQLKLPYSVKRLPDEKHYTYLDTVGRPVIVLQKENLVEHHIQDFEVHYEYSKIYLLQEPFLILCAIFALFIAVTFYVRLDFSITQDKEKEKKLRIMGYLENIQTCHENRLEVYKRMEDALVKGKQSKDNTTFQATNKQFLNEHKVETKAVADLISKLKQEGYESVDKVSEIQQHDKIVKDIFIQQADHLTKFLTNKMSKQQYQDAEKDLPNKRKEELLKINAILKELH